MPRHIKTFSDGSILEYDKGRFDEWCVYFINPAGDRFAPRDLDYFNDIIDLARILGKQRIYVDFVRIYNAVTKDLKEDALQYITDLAASYPPHETRLDKLFSVLYAGMVAEENKDKAILKKRIKRLGIHQLLMEDFTPTMAATFSLKKDWQTLNEECNKRGF